MQGGLFGRQAPIVGIHSDEIWVGPGVRAVATAHRLGKVAPLTTVIAPSRLSSAALHGIRLLLGQPLLQRLSSGRFRSRGAEQSAASISVAGVPGVVAIWIEHRVLGTVTLEELAHAIASGHVPTSELAAFAADLAGGQRPLAVHTSPRLSTCPGEGGSPHQRGRATNEDFHGHGHPRRRPWSFPGGLRGAYTVSGRVTVRCPAARRPPRTPQPGATCGATVSLLVSWRVGSVGGAG